MEIKPIILHEQQKLNTQDKDYVDSLGLCYAKNSENNIPPYLGLSADGWSSYYVGASWLKKGERPLIVHPKFERIDYMSIFATTLACDVKPHYFQSAYYINFDSPLIEDNVLNSVLSPLLVSHFLSVIQVLLSKGLKRNYIIKEENLKNKIKGHILPLRNIQKNVLQGHLEQNWCRFQEFSYDYPENRLLKRALLASQSLLMSLKMPDNGLLRIVHRCLISFSNISADITPTEVRLIRRNKIFGEYHEAIKLAKLILRRTDFSISDTSLVEHKVPEFTIDMSRIFEFHVLGILRNIKDKDVLFQEKAGIMGRCDYLIPSEQLIVDAKYTPNYPVINNDDKRNKIRNDIREVTGYGRSEHIRRLLNINDDSDIKCLIIYPNEQKKEIDFSNNSILSLAKSFNEIHNFYTLDVPIPLLEDTN